MPHPLDELLVPQPPYRMRRFEARLTANEDTPPLPVLIPDAAPPALIIDTPTPDFRQNDPFPIRPTQPETPTPDFSVDEAPPVLNQIEANAISTEALDNASTAEAVDGAVDEASQAADARANALPSGLQSAAHIELTAVKHNHEKNIAALEERLAMARANIKDLQSKRVSLVRGDEEAALAEEEAAGRALDEAKNPAPAVVPRKTPRVEMPVAAMPAVVAPEVPTGDIMTLKDGTRVEVLERNAEGDAVKTKIIGKEVSADKVPVQEVKSEPHFEGAASFDVLREQLFNTGTIARSNGTEMSANELIGLITDLRDGIVESKAGEGSSVRFTDIPSAGGLRETVMRLLLEESKKSKAEQSTKPVVPPPLPVVPPPLPSMPEAPPVQESAPDIAGEIRIHPETQNEQAKESEPQPPAQEKPIQPPLNERADDVPRFSPIESYVRSFKQGFSEAAEEMKNAVIAKAYDTAAGAFTPIQHYRSNRYENHKSKMEEAEKKIKSSRGLLSKLVGVPTLWEIKRRYHQRNMEHHREAYERSNLRMKTLEKARDSYIDNSAVLIDGHISEFEQAEKRLDEQIKTLEKALNEQEKKIRYEQTKLGGEKAKGTRLGLFGLTFDAKTNEDIREADEKISALNEQVKAKRKELNALVDRRNEEHIKGDAMRTKKNGILQMKTNLVRASFVVPKRKDLDQIAA